VETKILVYIYIGAEKVKGQKDLIRYKFYGGKAKNKRHLIACCSSLSILIICMYDGMWHAKCSRRAQPQGKKFCSLQASRFV